MGKGTIHIYIPEETGETAAAYGRALLDAAGGKKVVVIRFIKDKANCNSDFFKKMEPEMRLFSFEDIRNGINYARKVLATEECDLLLLAGLLELVKAERITVADLKIILDAQGETDIILTGPIPGEEISSLAEKVYRFVC